jgi:hypothetical protein
MSMPKKPKRDNAYYEERLKNESPSVYADFQAGKYPTLADALIAAGLRKQRTRLQELVNAWNKAPTGEKADFLKFLATAGIPITALSSPGSSSLAIVVNDRLTPAAISQVKHVMSARRLKMGDVMRELGFSPLDPSVGMAMKRASRLRPAIISALEDWLSKNSGI